MKYSIQLVKQKTNVASSLKPLYSVVILQIKIIFLCDYLLGKVLKYLYKTVND